VVNFKFLFILLLAFSSFDAIAIESGNSNLNVSERDRALTLLKNVENSVKSTNSKSPLQENVNYIELIFNIKKYPTDLNYEVFRVLKIVSEHYKRELKITKSETAKTKIETELSRIITSSEDYFKNSRNELAIQYFENLNMFLAKSTVIPQNQAALNEINQQKRAAELDKEFERKMELAYQNFAAAIDRLSKDTSTTPLKIIMDSYKDLKNRYLSADTKRKSENLLAELDGELDLLIRFTKDRKDSFGLKYFLNEQKFATQELEKRMAEIKHQMHMDEVAGAELLMYEFKNKISRFSRETATGKSKKTAESFILGETIIEISARDLVVSHRTNNVSYIAPVSSRKKAFSIKILNPSADSNAAVLIAAQTLLESPYAEGILYDDWLRIPTDLKNYTTSSLGANVLVRQNRCLSLFL